MSRLLVISCFHVCDEILAGKITAAELNSALFFLDTPRHEVVEEQGEYIRGYKTDKSAETMDKLLQGFREILLPAILRAEQENRCRWAEQLTWETGKYTNWQEHVEAFLLEHGYPKLFDDPETKSFLPFCSVGTLAISHAIRVLRLDITIV